ncbi:hypothetical protein BHQ21_15325 [Mycobacterium sherrisii]|uniref:Uncharacterized protein n=1 Tax=Mycobacterium sherrisii TaxID=243061 RepID=A0A1E3SSG6_9MYCO|nr:hypothetical protein BHQ21_15325 [Mycobacterium sherrisii]
MKEKPVEYFARSRWLQRVVLGLGGRLHLHVVRRLIVDFNGEVDYVIVVAVVFLGEWLDN